MTRLDAGAGLRPVAAVVLFFIATDCPISNRYSPELRRLAAEFAGRPIAFWLVYPNAGETGEGVLRHRASFGGSVDPFQGHVLLHPSAELMAITHATITPQAMVLVPEKAGAKLKLVYSGRIDDRYLDIGRERPQATRHDLELAIRAVLDDQPVSPAGGPPVGCGIISEAMLHGGAGK
ncbi:hypothetical protein ACPOL_5074 [Acidisarcina polymorpha]|uniref:Alkyl hydroperoxide reductase subunit C/ Thiol specific antioxidant domain-containing protein n=1 Tax=Acidisarcina polymorpha TaxID=2211140 RepID=A0A2Z5G5R6_9BACT|nr:hypothetical protein ACPOL_5074 [Acidisarcina polymorpha]